MLSNPAHIELMKKNPLFMDLTDDEFNQITQHTFLQKFKRGELLFRKQDPATDFFFLVKGKVKLSLLSIEGSEKVVDIIHEGHTFAEALIFRGVNGYPVNAETIANSEVLKIDASVYIKVLKNSPEACFKVMGCLSVRLHWLVNEIDRLSLHNAKHRLICYLLENIPVETTSATVVQFSVAKHLIASRISVTPETFSRTLKLLSQDGFLEIHDDHVVLNNPSELHKILSL